MVGIVLLNPGREKFKDHHMFIIAWLDKANQLRNNKTENVQRSPRKMEAVWGRVCKFITKPKYSYRKARGRDQRENQIGDKSHCHSLKDAGTRINPYHNRVDTHCQKAGKSSWHWLISRSFCPLLWKSGTKAWCCQDYYISI